MKQIMYIISRSKWKEVDNIKIYFVRLRTDVDDQSSNGEEIILSLLLRFGRYFRSHDHSKNA